MADAIPPEQFAVVELMGHVRMAGRVREVQQFGATMGRVDIPDVSPGAAKDAIARSVLFSGASIYRVTYCTEEFARNVAAESAPQPVSFGVLPPYRHLDEDDDHDEFTEESEREDLGI